jgi:hypothetical protein
MATPLSRTVTLILSLQSVVCARTAGAAAALPDPQMTYLDNGTVRIGLDLALGGAVTFIAGNSQMIRPRSINHFLRVILGMHCFLSLSNLFGGTVVITADMTRTLPISPWIYGINAYQSISDPPRNLTLNRSGGNRWTAYNWENNASNAGSDWGPFSNDDHLSLSSSPGEAVGSIIGADRARCHASLITVQMQGYVAADKNGKVDVSDPNRFTGRFREVVYQKNGPFTDTPSTSDAKVYMDEFLWSLRSRFTSDIYADPAFPTFVSLDNEPDLWSSTHAAIQPKPIAPGEFIEKSIRLCQSLKAFNPNVQLFGPVHFGFNGLINWSNAPGYSPAYWFTDHYLSAMKAASDAQGERAFKFTFGTGGKIMTFTGYVGFSGTCHASCLKKKLNPSETP